MATAANATYLGAIKPVGEVIPLSYVNEAAVTATPYIVDFEIDADYVVTGLEATKTVAANGAGGVVDVTVSKVGAGPIATAVVTQIAQCSLLNAAENGRRVFAGVGTIGTATTESNQFRNGDAADPLVKVEANGTKVGNVTKQRIRLTITPTIAQGQAATSSCFVLITLARFSDIVRSEELFKQP